MLEDLSIGKIILLVVIVLFIPIAFAIRIYIKKQNHLDY